MTARQLQVLTLIRERLSQTGLAPTYREISAQCGFSSAGHAHQAVDFLIDAGLVRKVPGRRRGLTLVDQPTLAAVPTEDLRHELARREAAETEITDARL
ncbi:hypothetical protein [Sphingomonas pituitosa]|uniref:LexA family protein n=1 Tax=Sphingomonas pituitosa TaxID=99597 RepID=UPI00082E0773|nr:hypothetical protein [Sphingomonas pituitosa]